MLDRDSQMKEVSFRLLGGDFQHHLVSSQQVRRASEMVVVDSRRVDLAAGMLDASSQRVSGGTMVPRATSARSRSIIWMLFQSGNERRFSAVTVAREHLCSSTSYASANVARSALSAGSTSVGDGCCNITPVRKRAHKPKPTPNRHPPGRTSRREIGGPAGRGSRGRERHPMVPSAAAPLQVVTDPSIERVLN